MSITPEYLYEVANNTAHKDALIAAATCIRQLRENALASKAEIERLRAALKPFATADFDVWATTGDCTIPHEAFVQARNTYQPRQAQLSVSNGLEH